MELRCPKCNSKDLKKVSLPYEEGSFGAGAQRRIRAAVVGGSGADLIVGRASNHASHQSALSKRLNPPMKWSYRKVIYWSVLVLLCGGWLVFYVKAITKRASTVMSPALEGYALVATVVFAFIVVLVMWHNLSVYPKRLADWDRSFICQRCGTVSTQ